MSHRKKPTIAANTTRDAPATRKYCSGYATKPISDADRKQDPAEYARYRGSADGSAPR